MLSATGLRAGEIHAAAAAGNLNKVRALVAADPSVVESRDGRGCTPLFTACIRYQVAVAHFLIDKGANVTARNNGNQTPLHAANGVFGQDIDLIKRMIAKGADVSAQSDRGDTPLSWAAARGNLKVARLLIDSGANVDAYDSAFGTILHNTINQNHPEMAELLIHSGAKLNLRAPSGRTELHLAAIQGHAELARLLIERGGDVKVVDRHDRTALYYAAKHSYRSVANVLTAAGADQSRIVEANYAKAPQLAAPLREGEAWLWFLGYFAGDGYAVKTRNYLLLFDPPGIDEGPEAGLANGHLNPAELAGQKIVVFITKPQWERYPLDVFELARRMADVEIVISYKPEAKLASQGPVPSYHLVSPHRHLSIGGVTVHTTPATQGGVSYLVEADGLKVYHAGYHTCNEASQEASYRQEIDFLKPSGPIDIALLPVGGHLLRSYTYDSYLHLLDRLSPKAVYLMHGVYDYDEYLRCAERLRTRPVRLEYPEGTAGGDRYHYRRVPADAAELPSGAPSAQAATDAAQAPRPLVGQSAILHSRILDEDRQYTVYLPHGYDTSQDRYPVLFMLDGPRHSNYAAGIAEYLSRYARVIPPVIVVDIAQQHRSRDMTPTPSADRPDDTGGGDRFAAFLAQEFVPHIQAEYRTRAPRLVWGYSLSGLFAVHTLLTRPETFDGYIASSPSLWWDDRLLVRSVPSFFSKRDRLDKSLFLAIGGQERQVVQDCFDQFKQAISEHAPAGFRAELRRLEGESHATICIPGLYQGIKALLADTSATTAR